MLIEHEEIPGDEVLALLGEAASHGSLQIERDQEGANNE
jgi:hypothetical protein